jgi:hypothetical protein
MQCRLIRRTCVWIRDGRIVAQGGYPLGGVDPRGSAGCLARRNTIYPQATKMTVVKTVSTAIFEPSFLNRHFQDLDAGELPGELTYVHRDAAL